jgi:ferritin-like metal-binding protein YciE
VAAAATAPRLKQAFEAHLAETEEHVTRLEQAYEALGLRPGRHKCEGMEGLLKEGAELIESGSPPDVLDAALIGAAQRVEHYEMASYGCARTHARLLGHEDVVQLLQRTLDEEGDADRKLTRLAERGINVEATPQRGNGAGGNGRAAAKDGAAPAKASRATAKAPGGAATKATSKPRSTSRPAAGSR